MTPANDNNFVQMTGGGNVGSTMAILDRLYEKIVVSNLNPLARSASGGGSVYVIGGVDPEYIKIGKATNVLSRLRSLQTGNPKRLYVHRVFSFEKMREAAMVEIWAHQDASRMFNKGTGEWFGCGPIEAHNLIAEICEKERIKCWLLTPETEHQWVITERSSRRQLVVKAEWEQKYG